MDWLDFIASVIRSVAWPTAACLVVWMLRQELRGLIGRLVSARGKGYELRFEKELVSLQQSSGNVEPEPLTVMPRLRSMTDMSASVRAFWVGRTEPPAAQVMAAWEVVVKAVEDLATRVGVKVHASEVPTQKVERLAKEGVISADDVALFKSLLGFRNDLIQGELGSIPALAFAAAADGFIWALELAARDHAAKAAEAGGAPGNDSIAP